jgi:plasmid maintenance system antidote protein VapI
MLGLVPRWPSGYLFAFDTSAESWLNQQSQYELWHAEQHREELKVEKLSAA